MKDFTQLSQQSAQFMVTEQQVMSLLSEMELFLAHLAQQPLPLSGTKHLPAAKWLESLMLMAGPICSRWQIFIRESE